MRTIIQTELDLAKYRSNYDYNGKCSEYFNSDFTEVKEYSGEKDCLKSWFQEETLSMPTDKIRVTLSIITTDIERNTPILLQIIKSLRKSLEKIKSMDPYEHGEEIITILKVLNLNDKDLKSILDYWRDNKRCLAEEVAYYFMGNKNIWKGPVGCIGKTRPNQDTVKFHWEKCSCLDK